MRFLVVHIFISLEEPHELVDEGCGCLMRWVQGHLSLHFHFFWSGLWRMLSV